jgi:hypothetical protein
MSDYAMQANQFFFWTSFDCKQDFTLFRILIKIGIALYARDYLETEFILRVTGLL